MISQSKQKAVDTPNTLDLELTPAAVEHFQGLLAKENDPSLNLRLSVINPGTSQAEISIVYCPPEHVVDTDLALSFGNFTLYVEQISVVALQQAVIDYEQQAMGGQLAVKAPFIRGQAPAASAPLEERLTYHLENSINPSLASHGGFVKLMRYEPDTGRALLNFGGGCQGCGMAKMTLQSFVEKSIKQHFPEISTVEDATRHEEGQTPYYTGTTGSD